MNSRPRRKPERRELVRVRVAAGLAPHACASRLTPTRTVAKSVSGNQRPIHFDLKVKHCCRAQSAPPSSMRSCRPGARRPRKTIAWDGSQFESFSLFEAHFSNRVGGHAGGFASRHNGDAGAGRVHLPPRGGGCGQPLPATPRRGLRAATGARRELQREETAPSELAGKRRPAARLRFRQPVPRPGTHRRSRSSRPQHTASPPRACRRTVASGNSASIARPVTSAGG